MVSFIWGVNSLEGHSTLGLENDGNNYSVEVSSWHKILKSRPFLAWAPVTLWCKASKSVFNTPVWLYFIISMGCIKLSDDVSFFRHDQNHFILHAVQSRSHSVILST